MKTIWTGFLLCLLMASSFSQQQFQPGVYSISGLVSFASDNDEMLNGFTVKATNYQFSPEFSFFVLEGVELTFGPLYARSDYEYTSVGSPTMEGSSTMLGIALGLRNYLIRSSVAPFVGAGGSVSWSKQKNPYSESGYTPPVWMYLFEAGVSFAVTDHFAVEPTFQYRADEDQQISGSRTEAAVRFKYFVFE